MSTASKVPETRELTGDDALRTLRHTGAGTLLRDGFVRLRSADGFSHARSLAFMTALVVVQGVIAIVGLAALLGERGLGGVIIRTLKGVSPGPASDLLTSTVQQATRTGSADRYLALSLGLVGALISATTMFGQLERACNRIYGVEIDRPTAKKYGFAFVLALSAGLLITASFVALALGEELEGALESESLAGVWEIVRWPLAIVLTTAAMTLLLRWSPRRQQPAPSWLVFGGVVSVAGWLLATALLGAVFSLASTFGETYGPLAGIVALLLWALVSWIGVLYGCALCAQLEAERARVPGPRDTAKDRLMPQPSRASRRRAKRRRSSDHRDGRGSGSSTSGPSTTSRSVV